MKNFIAENLFSIITAIFGGGSLLGWFVERNKRKAEEKQLQADALKNMQLAYDKFTADSVERYDALKEEIKHLKAKLEYIQRLSAEERVKYRKLEKEFEEYKKKFPGNLG